MLLKDICEIKSGFQGKTEEGNKYKIIKLKDVSKDGIIDYNNLESFDSEREPKKFLLEKGDVILKARSAENTAVAIDKDLENVVASSQYMILKIKDKEKVNPLYLELYLNSEYTQAILKRNSEGSVLPIIKLNILKDDLPIKIVPMEIQEKLIEVYSLVKQEKKYMQEIAEKRNEQYTAYIREYLD